jgi:hypothetical protein
MFAVRLWITTSPYRWPIGNLPSTCMLCTPPHCTKDVYTPHGSTRNLWTLLNMILWTHKTSKSFAILNSYGHIPCCSWCNAWNRCGSNWSNSKNSTTLKNSSISFIVKAAFYLIFFRHYWQVIAPFPIKSMFQITFWSSKHKFHFCKCPFAESLLFLLIY